MEIPKIPANLVPLSPNAGGIGDPSSLVGRKQELDRLKEAISSGGAHVTGERRMGKTWLVKKLQSDLANTVTAIYVSAETSSIDLFAERLLVALRTNRLIGSKVSDWALQFGGEVKLNFGVFGIALTGKLSKDTSTSKANLDVLELLGQNHVVLIIDEITHLCHKLGPELAGDFLSSLRSERQSDGPPLVISGSIGLHHALTDMSPINDLWEVPVGPMTSEDAVELAARLLLGIGVRPTPEIVADIIEQTSSIPFYIQGVIDQLRYRNDLDVARVVEECITKNTWQTDHYNTRLDEYYGATGAKQARAVLDFIATSDKVVDVDRLKDRMDIDNNDLQLTRDDLLSLLDKLEKDYYLVREGNADRMSSPLLSRIWRHHRRLT